MPRKKKPEAAAPEPPRGRLPTYRIKPSKGKFDLLQSGEWLETFDTQAEAEAEQAHRETFDRIRGKALV